MCGRNTGCLSTRRPPQGRRQVGHSRVKGFSAWNERRFISIDRREALGQSVWRIMEVGEEAEEVPVHHLQAEASEYYSICRLEVLLSRTIYDLRPGLVSSSSWFITKGASSPIQLWWRLQPLDPGCGWRSSHGLMRSRWVCPSESMFLV